MMSRSRKRASCVRLYSRHSCCASSEAIQRRRAVSVCIGVNGSGFKENEREAGAPIGGSSAIIEARPWTHPQFWGCPAAQPSAAGVRGGGRGLTGWTAWRPPQVRPEAADEARYEPARAGHRAPPVTGIHMSFHLSALNAIRPHRESRRAAPPASAEPERRL